MLSPAYMHSRKPCAQHCFPLCFRPHFPCYFLFKHLLLHFILKGGAASSTGLPPSFCSAVGLQLVALRSPKDTWALWGLHLLLQWLWPIPVFFAFLANIYVQACCAVFLLRLLILSTTYVFLYLMFPKIQHIPVPLSHFLADTCVSMSPLADACVHTKKTSSSYLFTLTSS